MRKLATFVRNLLLALILAPVLLFASNLAFDSLTNYYNGKCVHVDEGAVACIRKMIPQ